MNLLDQSPLWLIPYILLILLMVHAMMEFTVSLLAKRPPGKTKPVPAGELRKRLLALNEGQGSYPLTEGRDCDLEIAWETDETSRAGRYAIARSGEASTLRLLLDEVRHEVRMNQVTSSHNVFIGWVGWLPRLELYFGFGAGPPGQFLTAEIDQVVLRSGWSVRPVLWWFQATHRGYRTLEAITPAALRRLPGRIFWGIVYPLSYALSMLYLVLVMGPLDSRQWVLIIAISAAWWGMWGFLVWLLLRFRSGAGGRKRGR